MHAWQHEKTSFGPDSLSVVTHAFDDAWAEIAPAYPSRAEAKAARTALALSVLEVASDDHGDAGSLKRLALEQMAWRNR